MANAKMKIKMGDNRNLFAEIARALADLGEKPIVGALTVKGHEYWVVLEYGSSPMATDPGPKAEDEVVLVLPAHPPDQNDAYPYSKRHGSYYPINPRRAKMLRFFDAQGDKVFRHSKDGVPAVLHPGNYARGFLRSAIPPFIDSLAQDFRDVFDSTDDTIPSREELVDIFNTRLLALRDVVAESTPVSDGRPTHPERKDPTHLDISWGVDLAVAGADPDRFI